MLKYNKDYMRQNRLSKLRNICKNVDFQGHLVARSGNVTQDIQIGSVVRQKEN